MAMVPFYARFRDLALRETRSAAVQGMRNLPDGEYGFFEFYCDDPNCDCRRVLIQVACPGTGGKIWATLNYGWETPEFYAEWAHGEEAAQDCRGATLDPLNPQTEYSDALLGLFKDLLRDKAYEARLRRHYELFKQELRGGRRSVIQPAKKARRKKGK
jgi:hypothetical protein